MAQKAVRTLPQISGIKQCRGFTLLELMLVCALIVLAAGLSSTFLSGSDQKQFTVNLGQISAELRNARRQAIITGVEQEVKLATEPAEEAPPDEPPPSPPDWIDQNMRLRYAASLDDSLEEVGELAVTFFPMGSSTGGLLELSATDRRSYLYISPFTGKLIIESRLDDLEDRIEEFRP
jgi:prepilin-type N-terminal cleavage/methylation domain-containing protein